MQFLEEDSTTDWTDCDMQEVKETAAQNRERWKYISTNKDCYWNYFFVTDLEDNHYADACHIKVYVTVREPRIRELFTGAMKVLLQFGEKSFAAKISKKQRLEHMCFWTRRNDF